MPDQHFVHLIMYINTSADVTTDAKPLNTIFNSCNLFHVFVELIMFKLNPQFL